MHPNYQFVLSKRRNDEKAGNDETTTVKLLVTFRCDLFVLFVVSVLFVLCPFRRCVVLVVAAENLLFICCQEAPEKHLQLKATKIVLSYRPFVRLYDKQ